MAATVERAKRIYNRYKGWLKKYHGGAPPGFLAAIMYHESGGKMSSQGDPTLGEVGFFQITRSFPPSVGVPAQKRYDPETNVFLGALEYQIETARLAAWAPKLIELGTADSWKLSRLAFSIGAPGTRKLIGRATKMSPVYRGNVYAAVKTMVNSGGSIPLGRQSADKVRKRVNDAQILWNIGQKVGAPFFGSPEKIPAPSGISYRIPPDIARYFWSWPKAVVATGSLIGLTALATKL